METAKARMTSEQEEMVISVLEERRFKQVVEQLVAENVDISLPGESSLTLMERIYERHKGVDLDDLITTDVGIAVLIHCGADPNVNSYKTGCGLPDEDVRNIRSSLLHRIVKDYENLTWDEGSNVEFDDFYVEKQGREHIINMLIEAGARVWEPNYNPWERHSEKGTVVVVLPEQDSKTLFKDNMDCNIGDADHITVYDTDGNTTKIDISRVEGLKAWHEEYRHNCHNLFYDWQSWKDRGMDIAKNLAAFLPATITLFFPNLGEQVVEEGMSYVESVEREGDELCMLTRDTTCLSIVGNPIKVSQC